MAKTLTQMAAEILTAQASHSALTADEMSEFLRTTFCALDDMKCLEERALEGAIGFARSATEEAPKIEPSQSIQKDKVICLECGKEFKQLTSRHLREHGMNSKEYRSKYGFTARQALSAKTLSAKRRKIAKERNLGDMLKSARAKRKLGRGR